MIMVSSIIGITFAVLIMVVLIKMIKDRDR